MNNKNLVKLYPAGQDHALDRLTTFVASKIKAYDKSRDFPANPGTSILSPYLAIGTISVKQCLAAAVLENDNKIDSGNEGLVVWIRELCWRYYLLHHF